MQSGNVKKKKKCTPGVIYLSTIPSFMTVKKIREIFSTYGEIDHVFLQPSKAKGGPSNRFTEGWVEFLDKRIAKYIAAFLNNKLVGGKRKNKWHDCIWNIKYLHRFKWTHLNERLAYEKAVHDQRMRIEIAQAKRETNFFIDAVEKNKIKRKIQKRSGSTLQVQDVDVRQTLPEEEFKKRKLNSNQDPDSKTITGIDNELLNSIFC